MERSDEQFISIHCLKANSSETLNLESESFLETRKLKRQKLQRIYNNSQSYLLVLIYHLFPLMVLLLKQYQWWIYIFDCTFCSEDVSKFPITAGTSCFSVSAVYFSATTTMPEKNISIQIQLLICILSLEA